MKLKPQGANATEVQLTPDVTVLFSYQTPVACHVAGIGYARTDIAHSRTTQKHITQWLARNGARDCAVKPQAYFDAIATAQGSKT